MTAWHCSKATVALAVLTLFGCAQPVPTVYQPGPGPGTPAAAPAQVDAEAETDLVPPVPTFTTIGDCEMAYGPGACGSGAAIYGQANLAAPPDAGTWFMPFAFGVMTGVLVNRFYAPPSVYVAEVQYSQFIAPVVIQKYRIVTPATVRFYDSAPLAHRQSVLRTGPVRYAPRRGEFVGNPYGHGYTRPAAPPQRQAPGTLAPGHQPTPIGQRPGVKPPGPISQPQRPAGITPTTRPVAGSGTPKPTTGGTTPMPARTTTHKPPSASVQTQRPTPSAPRPSSTPAPAPKKPVPKPAPGEKDKAVR